VENSSEFDTLVARMCDNTVTWELYQSY